ncbi:N-acyl-aromatic-L-amino acid amidohydrolase (carboxylate-forming) B-like [Cyprinus carpio]|uniref:N-acyl-aromatic-L-amino acid amidohydrolase n=1 Tax=Cyprinus carpio TaxID=7962 RepID=A0A9Q9YFX8_CYPCA|nr:N-acyl-aromatic-L-amino acid amidohydrolase (carboxylate-forming) B-like [Cyprinus carpio]
MALLFLPALARMAVCGGTHGNELSGVYVVQEMERQRKEKGEGVWPIPVTTVLANPRAVKECRRYIDTDMNRCFSRDTLRKNIGGSEARISLRVVMLQKWKNNVSGVFVTLIPGIMRGWAIEFILLHFLNPNKTEQNVALEVGPQPHGVVRADIYIIMKEAVDLTIDWIHKFNSGTVFEGGDVEAFKFIKSVDYPRDPETRTLTAAIHPQLQDRDFCLLKRGDPLFFTFSGETVKYEEEETLHPFFINEAAYYEKGIAFHLAKKLTLTVPTVQVQKD